MNIMTPTAVSLLTICGLEELGHHSSRGVTHVLSILDPEWPDPEDFRSWDPHHRTTVSFHDSIEPTPGQILPGRDHVERILAFGRDLDTGAETGDAHLLVHCHMGVSRSTAAVAMLIAQSHADADEDAIFARLAEVRPQAWPNSLMIAFADKILGRDGRLTAALGRHYARRLAVRPEIEDFMRTHGRTHEIEMALAAASA